MSLYLSHPRALSHSTQILIHYMKTYHAFIYEHSIRQQADHPGCTVSVIVRACRGGGDRAGPTSEV